MSVELVKFVFWVRDMDRAISFYYDAFGLSLKFRSENWSELEGVGTIVALHGGRGEDDDKATGLSIQVTDIAETIARCEALGGVVIQAPRQQPGEPLVLARLRDPEGNVVMLTQLARATV